jgi:hypothetical protein
MHLESAIIAERTPGQVWDFFNDPPPYHKVQGSEQLFTEHLPGSSG